MSRSAALRAPGTVPPSKEVAAMDEAMVDVAPDGAPATVCVESRVPRTVASVRAAAIAAPWPWPRNGKAGKRIITLHLEQERKSSSASSTSAQQTQNKCDSGAKQGAAAD